MKAKNVFWGVFFICAAAMVVLSEFGHFEEIGIWSILITIFLIPLIARSLIKLNFYGVIFPLSFLFLIYAEPLFGIIKISFWAIMFTALFLSIGLSLIFRKKRFIRFKQMNPKYNKTMDKLSEDVLNFSETFSSSTKYIRSGNLQRVFLRCTFGTMKVFFDNAQLSPNGAVCVIENTFSTIELYVPRDWNVVNNVDPVFGSVDNFNRSGDNIGPHLEITGECVFGTVKLFYI